MHNDNPDRQASETTPDLSGTDTDLSGDRLVAGLTALVTMFENRVRLARERKRIPAEDIPADVPQFEVRR